MINKPQLERQHAFSLFSTIILNKIGLSSEPIRYCFKILAKRKKREVVGYIAQSQDIHSSSRHRHHKNKNEEGHIEKKDEVPLSVSDGEGLKSDRYTLLSECDWVLNDYLLMGSNKIVNVRHKELKSRVACILLNTVNGVLVIDPGCKNGFKINGQSSLDFDKETGLRTPILIKGDNVKRFKIKCHGVHIEVTQE